MKPAAFFAITILTVPGGVSSAAGESASPVRDWFPKAPPLPKPTGQLVEVATVDELFRAVRDVAPGGTILLADGHYMMPRYFELRTDDVTLRGKSGRRDRVVIDGLDSRHGELIGITAASGVTIADLTIQNIKWNGFKINSNTGVQRFRIYNCVIHNIWQRGIKAVGLPRRDRAKLRPKNCRVEHCLFYNDRAKRFADDETDTADTFGGDYIGGMDVMYATGWTISDNVFVGIRGRTGSARGAIFVWVDSRDCIIERNIIIDCDTGICLGNSHRNEDTRTHATRCVVRNNFVTRAPETGILADHTRDCSIVHNTIHDPDSRLKRLIRLVHDNDGLRVANNLLSGPPMRRAGASGRLRIGGNVTRVLTGEFVAALDGDLHLKNAVAGVVDAAEPGTGVAGDIDGQARDKTADIGADEFGSSKQTPNMASREEMGRYWARAPRDYDPDRFQRRVRGEMELVFAAPPGRKIKWASLGGFFAAHQGDAAPKTKNQIWYAVDDSDDWKQLYRADVPSWNNH